MKHLRLVVILLSELSSLKAQVTPLVAQLKQLQAQALGLGELSSPLNWVDRRCFRGSPSLPCPLLGGPAPTTALGGDIDLV